MFVRFDNMLLYLFELHSQRYRGPTWHHLQIDTGKCQLGFSNSFKIFSLDSF